MKASEKEALVHECLVKNYEKYYRMAYSYVFCEQDAMDIVQEGAYRAILKSDLLKQPEYVDTWICKIVINEALRFLKKNKLASVDMESLPEQGKEDEVEDIDLQRALEKLDNQERAIVVLRYFEEEKLENIGKTMNLNVNTVKSRLYRAMDKLKKYMETGGAEYGKLEKGV
ncbi:sigma-70 family RNA polymerase sigma factor [Hominiventricola filiformis]|uniref:Sigma-70 family RNA polymerase sigma factor n=1 Tax=Hominiventricola filiformis TaxID=2885352 RepID=A0AAE3A4Y2_9FIRM|nr:sigma-70 family RNA polymerase sigma factor [Hominiventricola filiformis]MCC2124619.1 sigma-70 family RNA polymerase sigma factor [Hominiventricola filiformis]RHU85890.1 RNA polymerase subunit sigma-24 [Clostridiaceae bacterium OM08-6BH]